MSLHDIAKHVQSQGRGQDSVLVHMTPNEVGGLQALAKAHGGSLTRNPQTGLYEAGFLSSVLPMVAGVAASAFLGPEMLPLIAGGVGLADYAMTGSLQQGLMAGLGAWGGYSLGAGIGAAGTADLAAQGADTSAETFKASQEAATEGFKNQAMDASRGMVEPPNPSELAKNQLSEMNLSPEKQAIFNDAIARNPSQVADIMRGAGASAVNPTTTQGFTQGITSLGNIGSAIKSNPLAAAGAALPLVSGSLFRQPTLSTSNANSVNTVNQPLQRLSSNYQGIEPVPPNPHYQAAYPNYVQTPYSPYTGTPAVQSPASTIYGADGGLMSKPPTPGLMDGGKAGNVDFMGGDMYPTSQQHRSYYATPTQAPTSAQAAMASYEPNTNPLTGEMTANMAGGGIAGLTAFATGGISNLGSYSDGGRLLKGPGDGVSDGIPAQIGARQPARLADGEFVVPARIVSELGNGSTDAGAKRLYAMMERVQAKRKKSMGKNKFAVNSKAEKDLPA